MSKASKKKNIVDRIKETKSRLKRSESIINIQVNDSLEMMFNHHCILRNQLVILESLLNLIYTG